MFVQVVKVEYVEEHRVRLAFDDGVHGMADLSPELHGEVFQPLRDLNHFQSFALEGHTLTWRNGADFAAEFPHGKIFGDGA